MIISKRFIKELLPRWIMIHKLKKNNTNHVLITFDDGPDKEITPVVLELLHKYNVRSVFFVVGEKAEKNPDLINLILRQGHIIANHTYSHPHDRNLTFKEYRSDMQRAQQVLYNITGKKNKLFRPPCGRFNLPIFLAAKTLGLKIVLWSNGAGEWSFRLHETAQDISSSLIKSIRNNQVILLHDNNKKIPLILENTLIYLSELQYDLKSAADELLN